MVDRPAHPAASRPMSWWTATGWSRGWSSRFTAASTPAGSANVPTTSIGPGPSRSYGGATATSEGKPSVVGVGAVGTEQVDAAVEAARHGQVQRAGGHEELGSVRQQAPE